MPVARGVAAHAAACGVGGKERLGGGLNIESSIWIDVLSISKKLPKRIDKPGIALQLVDA
jgi:hypothetical protein